MSTPKTTSPACRSHCSTEPTRCVARTWQDLLHCHFAAAAGDAAALLAGGGLRAEQAEARDPIGGHPLLHWAAARGCFTEEAAAAAGPPPPAGSCRRCIRAIVHAGASLEAADERGNTSAHWAAFAGSCEALAELARAGADLWGARNHADQTPNDVAWQAGQEAAVALLAELLTVCKAGLFSDGSGSDDEPPSPGHTSPAPPPRTPAPSAPPPAAARRPGVALERLEESLLCPITQLRLQDPVVAEDGHTYERQAIQTYLARGHRTSPITRQRVSNDGLRPNRVAKALLEVLAAAGGG